MSIQLTIWEKILIGFSLLMFLLLMSTMGMAHADDGCFAVTAYNDFGESGFSEVVCTDANTGEILPEGTVTLAWDASAGALGYKVYYRPQANTDWLAPMDVGNVLTCPIAAAAIFCPANPTVGSIVVNNP